MKRKKGSRGNVRYFHGLGKDSDPAPSTADRKVCSFWVGPRFGMGLIVNGGPYYRWIVVLRVSRGVLREMWVDQRTAPSRSTGQPIDAEVS